MDIIRAECISAAVFPSASHRRSFHALSFDMKKGEMLAVLGACGAGKSLLAHVLAQLHPISSGKLFICGMDAAAPACAAGIKKRSAILLQRGEDHFLSGYMDEELSIAPLSMGMSDAEAAERVKEALAFVGLRGYERSSPQLLPVFHRKRAALAAAISAGAELLILDEPFSGLCQSERHKMADIIKRLHEEGKGILLFTNDPDEAAMAERVLLLREGRSLGFGTAREILTDASLLAEAGLEPGFALRVYTDLKEAGISLENCPVSMDELVDEICR